MTTHVDEAEAHRGRCRVAAIGHVEPGRLNADPAVLAARMAGVRCASVLLAGEESWMVEPTARLVDANPRARMAVVPQAGHWVPLDNPGGFVAAVRGFLSDEA
jgi:pimeloyl-ACP methyl ester carboxylesterase